MTIKELEERTGLARANIRFYEDEGLLCPKRLPNGYRDYSEEDILTLEKIKLLRQLQLDINTIRLVQQGKLTLSQALFSQRNRLEGDKAVMERALTVCRELERSGVEYGALKPDPWLQALEPPREKALNAPPPPAEPPKPTEQELHYWTHRACDHPWRRFFARYFDWLLYKVLFLALFLLVFRWHGYLDLGWLVQVLFNMGIYCVSILVEPLWLHFVGWTPGKAVFGLKIRDKKGQKLSLESARSRAWQVAWQGDGLYIPFYSLWRNWKSYKCCADGEDCPWDVYEGVVYTCETEKRYTKVCWLGYAAVAIALNVLIVCGSFVPPHLGGLTVSEFARNYNDRLELYERDSYDTLTPEGCWQRGSYPYEGESVISINGGPQITVTGSTRWLDPEFTVEDGEVTAVTFVMESDRTILDGNYNREQFGFFAFTGAVEGLHLFNYGVSGWETCWRTLYQEHGGWDNFEVELDGIRVTQTVEASGYEPYYNGELAAIGVADPLCVRTVTISLVGSEE